MCSVVEFYSLNGNANTSFNRMFVSCSWQICVFSVKEQRKRIYNKKHSENADTSKSLIINLNRMTEKNQLDKIFTLTNLASHFVPLQARPAGLLGCFTPSGFAFYAYILGQFIPLGFVLCSRFTPSGFALASHSHLALILPALRSQKL